MNNLSEIYQLLSKVESELTASKKSLLEAARTIARLKSKAGMIAQVKITEFERERMTVALIQDLLYLSLPDGVSYDQLGTLNDRNTGCTA